MSALDLIEQLGLAPSAVLHHASEKHRVSVGAADRNLWSCSACDWFFWLEPPFRVGDVVTAQRFNALAGGRFVR